MTNGSFDLDSLAAYWREEAEEALRAAEHLIEKADDSYALFFGHLAVEKALKAAYVAPEGFNPTDPLAYEIRRTGIRVA